MSAEAGGESDTPKRRGRIPQSAWPHILERHRSGATLSAIAREFDCTPSAISYIVRKAEAAGLAPAESGGPAPPEPAEGAAAPDTAAEAPADAPPAAPPAEPDTSPEPVAPPAEPAAPLAEPGIPPAEMAEQRPPETARRETRSGTQLRVGGRREARQEAEPAEQRKPVEEPAAAERRQTAVQSPPSSAATQPSRSEPIDAVEARLRDTARSCLVAYRGWRTQPNETTIQSLSEAMHDLRKALARIEIDISATRRDEQAQRPIPIPAHRAARRPR